MIQAKEALRKNIKHVDFDQRLAYFATTLFHFPQILRERKEVGFNWKTSRILDQLDLGRAKDLDLSAKIEQNGIENPMGPMTTMLMYMGILGSDRQLAEFAYQLLEARHFFTPMTAKYYSRISPADIGKRITDPQEGGSINTVLSIAAVTAMRNIFDKSTFQDESRNKKRNSLALVNPAAILELRDDPTLRANELIRIITSPSDKIVDRGKVGRAQKKDTLKAFMVRAGGVGIPSACATVLFKYINGEISDINGLKPVADFVRNIGPEAVAVILDGLAVAKVGGSVGRSIDSDWNWEKILKRIGFVTGGAAGLGIAQEDPVLASVLGLATLMAKPLYFSPKERIKKAYEAGIDYLHNNMDKIKAFLPAIQYQEGKRWIVNKNGEKSRKIDYAGLKQRLAVMLSRASGLNINDIQKIVDLKISDWKHEDGQSRVLGPIARNSVSGNNFVSMILETIRLADEISRNPGKGEELMPILSPEDLPVYYKSHGLQIKVAIDALKQVDPRLALTMLIPSLHEYNFIDSAFSNYDPKGDNKFNDAVHYAGAFENEAGTGIRLLTSLGFWRNFVPTTGRTNLYWDFIKELSQHYRRNSAEGLRNSFSLIVKPPPLNEMINALIAVSDRGEVKHMDTMIDNLIARIDKEPGVLMDLLSFISYAKTCKLSASVLKSLGYNVEIDTPEGKKFFVDFSVRKMEESAKRATELLFNHYLSNPGGLILGFKKEIKTAKTEMLRFARSKGKNGFEELEEKIKNEYTGNRPEQFQSVYSQLAVLIEWVIRETPEFFADQEGQGPGNRVLKQFADLVYERPGVYSSGNVFDASFADIFYNSISALTERAKEEKWEKEDPRQKAFDRFMAITNEGLYVCISNTLKVNLNPNFDYSQSFGYESIEAYLKANFEFFEFALLFIDNQAFSKVMQSWFNLVSEIETNITAYVNPAIHERDASERRKKVNMILTGISTRLVAEEEKRLNDMIASGKIKDGNISLARAKINQDKETAKKLLERLIELDLKTADVSRVKIATK